MLSTGEFELETDGINLDRPWYINSQYLYYINEDNDFLRKRIGSETEVNLITTDVDDLYVSPNGKYVYLVKSGGLYYWDTSDKRFELKLIRSTFTDEDKFYLTNQDNTVYFISDMREIIDRSMKKGTAYKFVVGKSPETVMDGIMYMRSNDEQYINADMPLFVKYVARLGRYDFIVEYGSIEEGSYKTLFSNIEE